LQFILLKGKEVKYITFIYFQIINSIMTKLKVITNKIQDFREDINLFLYEYSNVTLKDLKLINNTLKTLDEVMKNVKITLPITN